MWAALSRNHRAKAIQRMTALDRWIVAEGSIDARQAAADAGLKSITRFYEMAKAWREHRSLASLGTFAGAPKTRVGPYDAELRRAVVSVVGADPTGSVRKLAIELEASSGIPADDMLSHNTFRRYVEQEKRRLEQRTMAGDDVMLDCSACTLTPSDPELVTLFAIIDRWTQIVLGAALGDIANSREGYARAAVNAQRRLEAGEFKNLPWVARMTRAEIVVGRDVDRWETVRKDMAAEGFTRPIEPSTKRDRFGRYLRDLTGLRLGTLVVCPKRTVELPAGALPTNDQTARLDVEVTDFNLGRAAELLRQGAAVPPVDLILLLTALSRSRSSN